jgi:hypothetical protein
MRFNIVSRESIPESVTVFHAGREYVATTEHPNFTNIIAVLNDHPSNIAPDRVIGMFDLTNTVADKFSRLSERVLVRGGSVLFDGTLIDDVLTQTIVGFYTQGLPDWQPLVFFMEKIAQNPNEHSRRQLFSWLQRNQFSIDAEGDIIAYKGVRRNGRSKDDADFLSVSQGKALVNGRWVEGRIPTSPGTIVEMPRDQVAHDPTVACHTGLHAGDWSYASTFADVTLRVKINPRDVVSVPNDESYRKMRVCRYRVLSETQNRDELTLLDLNADELRTRALPLPKPAKRQPTRTAAVKKSASPKAAKPLAKAAPALKFYEDFKKQDFATRPFNELRWLLKEWEVKTTDRTRVGIIAALARAAAARRRKNLKPRDKVKVVR